MLFRMLLEAFGDLATNQYASHVLETALRSWTERLGQEKKPVSDPMLGYLASFLVIWLIIWVIWMDF